MKLLVYLPCWTNYPLVYPQIESLKIQERILNAKGVEFNVDFIVSANAVSWQDIDSSSRDYFTTLGENFRLFPSNFGDVNINLGFIDAERKAADILWILSPNDQVSETALEKIHEFLNVDSGLDFIVADEEGRGVRDLNIDATALDFNLLSQASFGMVTGVIYRVSAFKTYLHLGVQASFLGWGQLAVLFGGARREGGINGRILPSNFFYFRGDPKILSHEEKMDNIKNYAHSFFGMAILIFFLSPSRNRDIRRWVFQNWYRIGAYQQAYESEKYGFVRLTDSRELVRSAVSRTDILTRIFYLITSKINFGNLKRVFRSAT